MTQEEITFKKNWGNTILGFPLWNEKYISIASVYVRSKGLSDRKQGLTKPPCKFGYYFNEYMNTNDPMLDKLPF
ncbi:MAG TPA: hypothetical protein VFC36_09705 [Paludibacter sp.]|nr:hypothetical protein [Paludibacter sp.]